MIRPRVRCTTRHFIIHRGCAVRCLPRNFTNRTETFCQKERPSRLITQGTAPVERPFPRVVVGGQYSGAFPLVCRVYYSIIVNCIVQWAGGRRHSPQDCSLLSCNVDVVLRSLVLLSNLRLFLLHRSPVQALSRHDAPVPLLVPIEPPPLDQQLVTVPPGQPLVGLNHTYSAPPAG